MEKQIAITESYLNSVFKLDNQSKKATMATIQQLSSNPRSSSLKIHAVEHQKCDPKFRSARINDNLRVIFVQQGQTFTLLYVDRHDDAYNWCNRKFLAKTDFGAEYIYDEATMLSDIPAAKIADPFDMSFNEPLLNLKEKHLVKLGLPAIHAKNLLAITSEDLFIDYITIFPSEIQEALLDLITSTKSFDEVYNSLIDANYDKTDESPLAHKDNCRRFYIPESLDELEYLMENDSFEKWTIFLHPSQEVLVQKNFNGPALIEGGPGTGKTIVGLHRACYLSKHVYPKADGKKILFCTFSKKLARVISSKLDYLLSQKGIENNIDVVSIDSFIVTLLSSVSKTIPHVDTLKFNSLIDELYSTMQPKGSKGFYVYEYFEIIERYHITTLEDYLNANRSGTGLPLDKKGREIAWRFLSAVLKEKEKRQLFTFADRAYAVLEAFNNHTLLPMYDSIIIDEAQDLELVKLQALCRCIRTTSNNIMILSDLNQRIFKLSTWKNDAQLNIVGRTYHLSINYRTTKQINDYARYQFVSSPIITAHIKEYKSIMNGADPMVVGFKNDSEQYKFLVTQIQRLLSEERQDFQICIVCPTTEECSKIQSIFTFSDIKTNILLRSTIPEQGAGICLCPITGVKGLEFESVIIYNYTQIGKGRIRESDSPAVKLNYTKLVECEKYVAATRARDELIITYVEEDS